MWSRGSVIVYNRWIYFICHSFRGLWCNAFEMGVAILCLPYIFRYPTVYYRVPLNQPCNGTMSTMYCTVATTQNYGALWTFGWWLWWPNNRGLYNQATSTMLTPLDGGVLWVFPDDGCCNDESASTFDLDWWPLVISLPSTCSSIFFPFSHSFMVQTSSEHELKLLNAFM
jgi:hypothetical protein